MSTAAFATTCWFTAGPMAMAMVVNASNRQKIVDWLAQHKGDRQVDIMDQTTATCMIAVQGPKAIEMAKD